MITGIDRNNIRQKFAIYAQESKSDPIVKVHREGARNTQLQVDFVEKVLSLMMSHVMSTATVSVASTSTTSTTTTTGTTPTTTTKKAPIKFGTVELDFDLLQSDFADILFKSKQFALSTSNKEIGWVKDVKSGNSAYASSKPTTSNIAWMNKADKFRHVLLMGLRQMAKTDTEKHYVPTWGDILRTPTALTIMTPLIAHLMSHPEGPRNLVFTHGFFTTADFDTVKYVYQVCTITVLLAAKQAKEKGLITDWASPKLATGKTAADVTAAFANSNSTYDVLTLDQIGGELDDKKKTIPSWNTFVKFGMVVSAGKMKENSLFWNPSEIHRRAGEEDNLFTSINNIASTLNAITGLKFKDDWDWSTYYTSMKTKGDNDIRKMEKLMKDIKGTIVYAVETRPGNVAKLSTAKSSNQGTSALKGKALF